MALAKFTLGMQYPVIAIDVPYKFKNYSTKGEGKLPPYPLMTDEEIAAIDILSLAANDCTMFWWTSPPHAYKHMKMIEDVWGFTYKTLAPWIKMTKKWEPANGTGYIFRGAAEIIIVATRGKPKKRMTKGPKGSSAVRGAFITEELELDFGKLSILAERGNRHSRKPEEIFIAIEQLYEGPYLELFARPPVRPGWDAQGNEV